MNTTKIALEASLKELLKKKPFDKITIADLTEDCGISRMAFYYHFKDIYDLVEWACVEDGKKALRDKKTYDTWQEGFAQMFQFPVHLMFKVGHFTAQPLVPSGVV